MSDKPENPQAFPSVNDKAHYYGMTLRDYFAGQVLACVADENLPEYAGEVAYEYADAMLKARKS